MYRVLHERARSLVPVLIYCVMNFILLGYTYNSGCNTEMINKQCKAGDPLETPGGLYRGPPSMLINVNTIKRCACVTLNQVQFSITMNVNLL